MSLYKTPDGSIHDDMDGTALSLSCWPKDAVLVTDEEVALMREDQAQQMRAMAPIQVEVVDPVQKLKDFLQANPDVEALIK